MRKGRGLGLGKRRQAAGRGLDAKRFTVRFAKNPAPAEEAWNCLIDLLIDNARRDGTISPLPSTSPHAA